MSIYYNPRRTRNLFNPSLSKTFKLSRTKIDLFLECPRCFYLDCRLGIGRPPSFPLALNSAVDKLLKKEFDIHRLKISRHPLMEEYGIDATPFQHEKIDEWRNNFKGVQYLHKPTNLTITGAIDDLWINSSEELIVVEYKATSKSGEVSIDEDWQICYKRQMEIYQWLFRRNGFRVSNVSYFVYCNGDTDKKAFDKKIEFDVKIIPYEGNDKWVERAVFDAHKCLNDDTLPTAVENCDFCRYRDAVKELEK